MRLLHHALMSKRKKKKKKNRVYTAINDNTTWSSQAALLVKNLLANTGGKRDLSSIPGSGRSPGGENGNPLHYSYLVAESRT